MKIKKTLFIDFCFIFLLSLLIISCQKDNLQDVESNQITKEFSFENDFKTDIDYLSLIETQKEIQSILETSDLDFHNINLKKVENPDQLLALLDKSESLQTTLEARYGNLTSQAINTPSKKGGGCWTSGWCYWQCAWVMGCNTERYYSCIWWSCDSSGF